MALQQGEIAPDSHRNVTISWKGNGRRVAALICIGSLGFVRPAQASSEAVLYSFVNAVTSPGGCFPDAGLTNMDGTLYGAATGCGMYSQGTIFSLTQQDVFAVTTSFFPKGALGTSPNGTLLDIAGTFYGTTQGGGTGFGTVFSLTPSGVETLLYTFKGHGDGAGPADGLIYVGGTFFGTTESGAGTGCGGGGCGTVFKVTKSGIYKKLHAFAAGTDGAFPYGGLVSVSGTLYGTTMQGGGAGCTGYGAGCGTIFKITSAGVETILYRFTGGTDGGAPYAGLVNVGGTLYGTTLFGGSTAGKCGRFGCGTVFKVAPDGTVSPVYAFKGAPDAAGPVGGLLNVGGVLYGAAGGGSSGFGAVYKLTQAGAESVVYSFKPKGQGDGAYPRSALVKVGSTLYGTTYEGGAYDGGAIYAVVP